MNWKEQLTEKAKQLNIKEVINGCNQTASGNLSKDRGDSSRSNNSDIVHKNSSNTNNSVSGRGIDLSSRNKTLINVERKEKAGMITIEDALKDLDALEISEVTDGVKTVRAIKVLVKFLSTIRSNQLLTETEKTKIQVAKEAKRIKK